MLDRLPDPRRGEPLSDRSLSDIGIDHEEVTRIARKHHEHALIRHDQIGMLLGMSDEELAVATWKPTVPAVKFLRRHFVDNETAA